jgi:Secretion system C-terminal sorting domain
MCRGLVLSASIFTATSLLHAQWEKAQLFNYGNGTESIIEFGSNLYAGILGGVGGYSDVYLSTNTGVTWLSIGAPVQHYVVTLTGIGSNLFAGTEGSGIYISADYGATWTPVDNGLADGSGSGVSALTVSGSNLFVATAGNYSGTHGDDVYLSTDNGASWNPAESGLPTQNNKIIAIFALVVNGSNIFAGTDGTLGATVYRSTNNGANWFGVDSNVASNYGGVRCLAASGSNVFAGTDIGDVLLSTDNGSSWAAIDSGLGFRNSGSSEASALLTLNDSTLFAATAGGTNPDFYQGGGVYAIRKHGIRWDTVNTGLIANFVNSLAISGGYLFAGVVDSTGESVWRLPLSEALPVELTSFTALAGSKTVELAWKTATEINNAGFDIERTPLLSPLGEGGTKGRWAKIGFVGGHGSTNSPHNYSYTDNVGSAGTYSYRLKQVDHNGAFTYSQEVKVAVGAAPNVFALNQNYPNPFNPSTDIQFTVPTDGRAILKVYNTLGQEVAILFDGIASAGEYHHATFDASKLASGIYFSQLEFEGKMQVKKMLLLK